MFKPKHGDLTRLAAVILFDEGFNFAEISQLLGPAHQTIRTWIVPDEAYRMACHAAARRSRIRNEPTEGRCEADTEGVPDRIAAHKTRVARHLNTKG